MRRSRFGLSYELLEFETRPAPRTPTRVVEAIATTAAVGDVVDAGSGRRRHENENWEAEAHLMAYQRMAERAVGRRPIDGETALAQRKREDGSMEAERIKTRLQQVGHEAPLEFIQVQKALVATQARIAKDEAAEEAKRKTEAEERARQAEAAAKKAAELRELEKERVRRVAEEKEAHAKAEREKEEEKKRAAREKAEFEASLQHQLAAELAAAAASSSLSSGRRGSDSSIDIRARVAAILEGTKALAGGEVYEDVTEGLKCVQFWHSMKYSMALRAIRGSKDATIRSIKNEITKAVGAAVNKLSSTKEGLVRVWTDLNASYQKIDRLDDTNIDGLQQNQEWQNLVQGHRLKLEQLNAESPEYFFSVPFNVWSLYFLVRFIESIVQTTVTQCTLRPTAVWICAYLLRTTFRCWPQPLFSRLFSGAIFFHSILSIPIFPNPVEKSKPDEHLINMGLRCGSEDEESFYKRSGVLTRLFVSAHVAAEKTDLVLAYMSRLVQRIHQRPKRGAPFVLASALEVASFHLQKQRPQQASELLSAVELQILPALVELVRKPGSAKVNLMVPVSAIETFITNWRTAGRQLTNPPDGYVLKDKAEAIGEDEESD